jgi:hydrogenase maturation protease
LSIRSYGKYDRSMNSTKARCLLLACGNTLRGDDGIGPWLAEWAEKRFADERRLKVISRQQWTPELAADIAEAEFVLFIDCSTASEAGFINVMEVMPAQRTEGIGTHHVGAPELLGIAQELYGSLPRQALLLTIGAGSTELSEEFSQPVLDAIPLACAQLEQTLTAMFAEE